ncbi:RnfH family protein [Noviherbaspirillum sp. CPCC 100848]|uniref:UPF0125 protein RY831_09735 n=1 Tax=Noviherbaspirillum album TaxID=3080276 RepID=A0ABU6J708_9BURK|nr:RnfH family protein [Noviherbaspirillum sp. CPCC 100848]MEC4719431.1 RnfH family protein [Noviherbaspirillum sp. CPCC 100848]
MAEIGVEVCHALPDRQLRRALRMREGSTLGQAIEQSGLLQEVPGIDLGSARVGIYGKLKSLDTILRDRDRIEIYRPLIADPKEARRRRAGRSVKSADTSNPAKSTQLD